MSVLIILSFFVSFLTTLLVVRFGEYIQFTSDSDLIGVQKFHTSAVPRVGGLGIVFGILVAFIWDYFQNSEESILGLLLIFSSLPVFLSGITEDLTKKVRALIRLSTAFASAALAGYVLNAWLTSVQIFGVDNLMLVYPFFAVVITCVAVGGVANSFNMIDGYNGLSAMVAVIILSAIAYVAFMIGDNSIVIAALTMIGGLLGFLIWNYPRGLIFLGDGGAYLVGFWIAELSILLTIRNSEVSKWFPLLLCAYPIVETLFTIYRRIFISKSHPGMPDALHMHQLIYKRIVRWGVGSSDTAFILKRNALTSPYLWVLALLSVIPAVIFWQQHMVLKFFTLLFVVTYICIYRSIVRFKVPNWICIRNNR